jgi:SET domain-containing protein
MTDIKLLNKQVKSRYPDYKQYNKHLVEIKQSCIPGAGLGLFAIADIPKDTIIDIYHGKRLTKKEYGDIDGEKTMYIMEINRNLYIDASIDGGIISFTNDARGLNRTPGVRNNCYFELAEDGKEMYMKTSKNIKAGNELFTFYGTSYWNTVKYFVKEGLLTF